MAPDGEDITYQYPDCHFPLDGQAYEETVITLVDKYTGTTAYTRPLTCHPAKGTAFSDTAFTEPRPFLQLNEPNELNKPAYGLRLSSTNSTNPSWWMERPDGVWRAPHPADSPLDLTNDIVSLNLNQSTQSTQQTLQTQATLVVPTNVFQELLDVVEVTDERCGIDQEKYRVQAIKTDHDRRKRTYDQRLTLGSP